MITVSKGLFPFVLAQMGNRTFDTPQYEHKSGTIVTRYANIRADCGSAKHATIRVIPFDTLIYDRKRKEIGPQMIPISSLLFHFIKNSQVLTKYAFLYITFYS